MPLPPFFYAGRNGNTHIFYILKKIEQNKTIFYAKGREGRIAQAKYLHINFFMKTRKN